MLTHYFGTSVIGMEASQGLDEVPEEEDDNPVPEVEYDDDLFVETALIKGEEISVLAILSTGAVKGANRQILVEQSEKLLSVSEKTWLEIEMMNVSINLINEKRNFQYVMVKMISLSSSMKRGLPGSEREREEFIQSMTDTNDFLVSTRKNIANKGINHDSNATPNLLLQVQIDQKAEQTRALNELDGINLFPLPDGLLPLGRGFKYMDSRQSNDITIVSRYVRVKPTYWYDDENNNGKSTIHVNAPYGKTFFVIHIRVAHSGNRDGKIYAIKTPALSAFSLHGAGETFSPISTCAYTEFGEMYTQKTLGRNERVEGSLLFEVPFGLKPADAYLTVNLGSTWGEPGWVLG